MKQQVVERLSDEYYDKYNLAIPDTDQSVYFVPSIPSAILSSKETWDKQYDAIEHKVVEGGLPVLWERLGV